MKFMNSFSFLVVFLFCTNLYGQKNANDYEQRAAAIKKEVWNWKIPAFEQKKVPVAYEGEAVVLARHQEIKAIVNSGGRYKDMQFVNTFREQVKINDKATLEEFSEFSYNKYSRRFLWGKRNAGIMAVLGIRIIKPDGTVKELDVSEEVLTKNEKNEKDSKIAISGLEVGDIIDYFLTRIEDSDVRFSTDPYLFAFGDDKPILHYSIHGEFGDACAIEFRSMNGAPEFKVSKNAAGNNILDVEMKDMPKAPVNLWMSAMRQLPIVRLNVRVGGPRKNRRKPGEVYRNQDYLRIIEDVKIDIKDDFYQTGLGFGALSLAGQIKSMIKRMRRDEDLPKDSLPYYIYYAFRYIAYYQVSPGDPIVVGPERNLRSANNKKFLVLLSMVMDKLGVQNDIILATSRYGPEAKQAMLESDFEYILKTTAGKPIYMCADGVFTNCNYIPAAYEGQQDPVITIKKFTDKMISLDDDAGQATIPVTTYKQNVQIEKYRVSLLNNMENVKINRQTILKGQMRDDEQRRLILFEDSYEEERKALGIKESFMETFADSKKNRTLADEYTAAFAKARSEWKDQFLEEITEKFDKKPLELSDWKIDNMGLRHSRPDLIYSTVFTMDGWMKKGGNNYIMDIGKLIGAQLQLKANQLDRKVDIYMPFARSFEYIIAIEVPGGYKVEGADKLSVNINNEAGAFLVEIKQTDNLLQLHIIKTYAKAFQKVNAWQQILEVVNAANEFQNKKILFRKG